MSKPKTATVVKPALQQAQLYTDLSEVQRSTFTLTFVVEIVGIDVWHDCNEGWLDLGPCSQGIKFTYQLYYGRSYDLDILIWPHTAKIWHGENRGWVRSWQFLEHRFIAFSIRHALPVRVKDLLNFETTVTPTYGLTSLGSNARNDKNTEVYLPKLEFGQQRYFAPVVETLEEPLHTYFRRLIWNAVVEFIPPSFLDGVFDTPLPVTDVRLQDAVIEHVRNLLLNRSVEDLQKLSSQERTASKGKIKRDSKSSKFEISLSGAAILAGTNIQSITSKATNSNSRPRACAAHDVCATPIFSQMTMTTQKRTGMNKNKRGSINASGQTPLFLQMTMTSQKRMAMNKNKRGSINASGQTPLFLQMTMTSQKRTGMNKNKRGSINASGTGRVRSFKTSGDRLMGTGEIIVLITSSNLPAQDDLPVLFVNVGKLFDVPLKELRKHRITQLYTRWILNDEKHDSETQDLKSLKFDMDIIIDFKDHYAVPLDLDVASKITSTFLDTLFEIQLRGRRLPAPLYENPKYFGYEKGDCDFGTAVPPKPEVEDLDPLIALTKINALQLAKCLQTFISGEYPLFPPPTSVAPLNREAACTNDVNAIGAPIVPNLVIPSYVILQAQMTLEASMGIVGCRPRRLQNSFSRMFALLSDSDSAMTLIRYVREMNEEIGREKEQNLVLTGFAIDAGDKVVFFLEGPRDGYILKVWEMTEDYYPKIKPVFSSSSRYASRVYPELLPSVSPFVVLKMYAPLGLILACPSVYSRPALPLPTRSCVLKLGRLIASRFRTPPCRAEMPSHEELVSFNLELCSPPLAPFAIYPNLPEEVSKEAEVNQAQSRPATKPGGGGASQSSVNWEKPTVSKKI